MGTHLDVVEAGKHSFNWGKVLATGKAENGIRVGD